MDLRVYYKKIRDEEAKIADEFVWVTSLATDEGGVEGIVTQVRKGVAARVIVDRKSRMATDEEILAHLEKQEQALRKIRDENVSQRLQVAILTDSQFASMREQGRQDGKKD